MASKIVTYKGRILTENGKIVVVDSDPPPSACCCPGFPPGSGDCSGNCVCTLTNLTRPDCNDETPTKIKFKFDADVTCTPAACDPLITAGTYELVRVPAGSQDECCDYYQGVTAGWNCCDCLFENLATGFGTAAFDCKENQSNECVVYLQLVICDAIYEIYDWDFDADSTTPNVMTRIAQSDCCTYPATLKAWGE